MSLQPISEEDLTRKFPQGVCGNVCMGVCEAGMSGGMWAKGMGIRRCGWYGGLCWDVGVWGWESYVACVFVWG